MAGPNYGAYNQRSARFRRRPMPDVADEMALAGRTRSTSGNYKTRPGAPLAKPWTTGGQKGAGREQRPGDTMGEGLTAPAVWDSFFHGHDKAATVAGVSPSRAHDDVGGYNAELEQAKKIDTTGAVLPQRLSATDSSWAGPSAWEPSLAGDASSLDPSYFSTVTPDAANPDSYVQSALNSQDGYFSKLGAPIARPRMDLNNTTVPPLPNPMAITGNSSGYDNAFGSTPALPDQPYDFSMDQEL